jgi:hypothetical protein
MLCEISQMFKLWTPVFEPIIWTCFPMMRPGHRGAQLDKHTTGRPENINDSKVLQQQSGLPKFTFNRFTVFSGSHNQNDTLKAKKDWQLEHDFKASEQETKTRTSPCHSPLRFLSQPPYSQTEDGKS